MKEMMWKIELFYKCVWYETANWILKQRIKMAWARMAVLQDELDRVKNYR